MVMARSGAWRTLHPARMRRRDLLDAAIEAPVVTSFSHLGYAARKRLDHWTSLDHYDLTGRVIVVTGATSGLGKPPLTDSTS